MTGTIILVTAPILIGIGGFFAERYGKKFLCCVLCGIVTFIVFAFRNGGGDYNDIVSAYRIFPAVSYTSLVDFIRPPGFVWLIKLISLLIPDADGFMVLMAAVNSVGVSVLIYKRCSASYTGAFVYASCFMITAFYSFCTYTAALITALAFRYIEEKRFFRFVGFVILAACFDMSAVLLIPIFFLTFIDKTYITAVISVLIMTALIFIPDAVDTVFGFIGTENAVSLQLPLFVSIVFSVFAVLCIILSKMLTLQKKPLTSAVNALIVGAAMLVLSAFDGRFFTISLCLLLPSVMTVMPEMLKIAKILTQKAFLNRSGLVYGIVVALGILLFTGINVYFALNDTFGTSAYTLSFLGEANI